MKFYSVAGSPTLLLVIQTSATSVIVEWSQPSGGATVTGYVIHYSHGNSKNIIITECNTTDNNTTDSNMTDSNTTDSSMTQSSITNGNSTNSNITDRNTTTRVPGSSTHALITNLTNCYKYTFSVEATSEHLSGMSKIFILKLGMELQVI